MPVKSGNATMHTQALSASRVHDATTSSCMHLHLAAQMHCSLDNACEHGTCRYVLHAYATDSRKSMHLHISVQLWHGSELRHQRVCMSQQLLAAMSTLRCCQATATAHVECEDASCVPNHVCPGGTCCRVRQRLRAVLQGSSKAAGCL